MKKVLRFVGINVTKQTFAKGVSKVVPVVGGFVSGGITYASFKPGAEQLRRYLRSLPLSGIDGRTNPDIAAIRADLREKERAETVDRAKEAGAAALKTAGNTVASGAQVAGVAVVGAANSAGAVAADAARAAGGALASLFGKGRKEKTKGLSGARLEDVDSEPAELVDE